jgi:hypothetical protein
MPRKTPVRPPSRPRQDETDGKPMPPAADDQFAYRTKSHISPSCGKQADFADASWALVDQGQSVPGRSWGTADEFECHRTSDKGSTFTISYGERESDRALHGKTGRNNRAAGNLNALAHRFRRYAWWHIGIRRLRRVRNRISGIGWHIRGPRWRDRLGHAASLLCFVGQNGCSKTYRTAPLLLAGLKPFSALTVPVPSAAFAERRRTGPDELNEPLSERGVP